MSKIFNNKTNAQPLSEREKLEQKYNRGLANLLLVIIFTVINVVLLVTNADRYFLFSAFVPYLLASFGMLFCGLFPEEYYYDMPVMEYYDTSFMVAMIAIALVILSLYFLGWFFAKKKKVGWLIFALVLFAVDTITLLLYNGFATDSIIDILFHAWVLFYLISSTTSYFKLKKLPAEPEMPENAEQQIIENSSVLRVTEPDIKARVLLEADEMGHHIVYRRIKRVNELVVDDRVYDEYEAFAEGAHTLSAFIDGHKYEAKFDGAATVYIFVDGRQIAKKMRLY